VKSWWLTTEPMVAENYQGLPIHAAEGLHDQVVARLAEYVPVSGSVLDLGAGSGALSLRLQHLGYTVTAADVCATAFQAATVPFVQLDLDDPHGKWLSDRTFDAVCSIEVIEHVRNPWQLLNDCHRLLKPGGLLLLSTPNVTSFLSRLLFLYKGRLFLFEDADRAYGHINPLCFAELEMMAADCAFDIVGRYSGGYLPLMDFSVWRPRRFVQNLVRLLTYPLMRGPKDDVCLIYVLRKQ
jgi:2-polyprenyl-3-methyl-5-hydroxy-6-metoxy-1,4-benzoquinol methylase